MRKWLNLLKRSICRTGAARRIDITPKGQVIDILFTEYNEAEIMDAIARNEHRLGKAEGRAEGETRLAALISAMAKGSDAACVAKVSDPAFREKMYKKYNL